MRGIIHPDSGDPSGAQWSVSRCAVEPAYMRVKSHQRSSTLSCTSCLIGFWKKKKKTTNILEVVSSQFISQAKSSHLSCGKERSVTSACPDLLSLPGSGRTLTKQHRSQNSQGLSFIQLISQGVGHRPGCPECC